MFTRLARRLNPRRALTAPGLSHCDLDEGLDRIAHRLGLECSNTAVVAHTQRPLQREEVTVVPTTAVARSIYYAPDMDGQADPGEVVWMTLADDEGDTQERAFVVVGRTHHEIMALLISPNAEHAEEKTWLDIGSGVWESSGRNSWVRLDKVVTMPEDAIRRQGAVMPRRRYDRIAHRLRSEFGWN
ncbi:hypothetical protein C1Y63_04445 [Corynebacterium sp. 13CS0277]|nr:hypothetical protein C1Y63_04445 [Corynebacterium sp. 13CS0277]